MGTYTVSNYNDLKTALTKPYSTDPVLTVIVDGIIDFTQPDTVNRTILISSEAGSRGTQVVRLIGKDSTSEIRVTPNPVNWLSEGLCSDCATHTSPDCDLVGVSPGTFSTDINYLNWCTGTSPRTQGGVLQFYGRRVLVTNIKFSGFSWLGSVIKLQSDHEFACVSNCTFINCMTIPWSFRVQSGRPSGEVIYGTCIAGYQEENAAFCFKNNRFENCMVDSNYYGHVVYCTSKCTHLHNCQFVDCGHVFALTSSEPDPAGRKVISATVMNNEYSTVENSTQSADAAGSSGNWGLGRFNTFRIFGNHGEQSSLFCKNVVSGKFGHGISGDNYTVDQSSAQFANSFADYNDYSGVEITGDSEGFYWFASFKYSYPSFSLWQNTFGQDVHSLPPTGA